MAISNFPKNDFSHKKLKCLYNFSPKSIIFKIFKNLMWNHAYTSGMLNVRLIYQFWQTYSPKLYSLMTPFFQTAILSISRYRTGIKMTFLGILRPNWFRNTLFYSKISIWKFNLIWHGVDLTLRRCWLAWSQIANGFDFLILRSKRTITMCHMPEKKNFWFWWPFVPFRYLTLTLTCT